MTAAPPATQVSADARLWRLDADPQQIDALAAMWRSAGDHVSTVGDSVLASTKQVIGASWQGSAATAAGSSYRGAVTQLDRTGEIYAGVSSQVDTAANILRSGQQRLDGGWELLRAAGIPAASSAGSIVFSPRSPQELALVNGEIREATQVRAQVDAGLNQVRSNVVALTDQLRGVAPKPKAKQPARPKKQPTKTPATPPALAKDNVVPRLAWNKDVGGLDLFWTVTALNGTALQTDGSIEIYFANGAGAANKLGAMIIGHQVPSGTTPGSYGPVNINGEILGDDPSGTTHLIAVSATGGVGAVRDVQVSLGSNAHGQPAAAMMDIIKDGLRVAGVRGVTISRTYATAEDQARAMFGNLAQGDVAQRIRSQLARYGSNGDKVIRVFEQTVAGHDLAWIQANAATVQAAMVKKIEELVAAGGVVSKHMVDPTKTSTADIGYSQLPGQSAQMFIEAVRPRVSVYLDEPENHCHHFELNL
jgi:Proteins of 100 residues with WXG